MVESIFVFCTVPNTDIADKISYALLEKHLAACVSRSEKCESIYWWNGVLEIASEWNLTIKTIRENYEQVEQQILALHPYDTPEIVAIPVLNGFKPYLAWIEKETNSRV